MNPYLQAILADFSKRIAELESEIKMITEECKALREQLNEK